MGIRSSASNWTRRSSNSPVTPSEVDRMMPPVIPLIGAVRLLDLFERSRPAGIPTPHLDLDRQSVWDAERIVKSADRVCAALATAAGVLDISSPIEGLEQKYTRPLEFGAVELAMDFAPGGDLGCVEYLRQTVGGCNGRGSPD